MGKLEYVTEALSRADRFIISFQQEYELMNNVVYYSRRLNEANVNGYNYNTEALEEAIHKLDLYMMDRDGYGVDEKDSVKVSD